MQMLQPKKASAETPTLHEYAQQRHGGEGGRKSGSGKIEQQKLQCETQSKSRLKKKIDGALRTRGMITKDLTFPS